MPQRHRNATHDELTELIVEYVNVHTSDTIDGRSVGVVLDALAAHDVNTNSLVKILVDEDVAPDLQ